MEPNLTEEIALAIASIGANALVFSWMLGRKYQRFEDSIAAIVKDVGKHETRLEDHAERFDRHEGKIVRLTVAGAQLATALSMKYANPHHDEHLMRIAESFQNIHGGRLGDTPT